MHRATKLMREAAKAFALNELRLGVVTANRAVKVAVADNQERLRKQAIDLLVPGEVRWRELKYAKLPVPTPPPARWQTTLAALWLLIRPWRWTCVVWPRETRAFFGY